MPSKASTLSTVQNRLMRLKGQVGLLEAVAIMAPQVPDFPLGPMPYSGMEQTCIAIFEELTAIHDALDDLKGEAA